MRREDSCHAEQRASPDGAASYAEPKRALVPGASQLPAASSLPAASAPAAASRLPEGTEPQPPSALPAVLKRTVDLAFAVPACILLAPLFLGVAVAIRLDSPGPVF